MQKDHRKTVTLVLGGVRSGKSRYAQQLGERAERVVFVATAHAGDDEMQRKIELHRGGRPANWTTVEEPLALAEAITQHGPGCDLMIIDCLTFFATNLLLEEEEESAVEELCAVLAAPPCSVVLVSNEVGSGVVPPYPLGRRFRDLLGEMNQRVASVATDVLLLVAGLPLVLKGAVKV